MRYSEYYPELQLNNTHHVKPSDRARPSDDEISQAAGTIRQIQYRHGVDEHDLIPGFSGMSTTGLIALSGASVVLQATRFIRSADEIDAESGIKGFGSILAEFECEADLIAQKYIANIQAIE